MSQLVLKKMKIHSYFLTRNEWSCTWYRSTSTSELLLQLRRVNAKFVKVTWQRQWVIFSSSICTQGLNFEFFAHYSTRSMYHEVMMLWIKVSLIAKSHINVNFKCKIGKLVVVFLALNRIDRGDHRSDHIDHGNTITSKYVTQQLIITAKPISSSLAFPFTGHVPRYSHHDHWSSHLDIEQYWVHFWQATLGLVFRDLTMWLYLGSSDPFWITWRISNT